MSFSPVRMCVSVCSPTLSTALCSSMVCESRGELGLTCQRSMGLRVSVVCRPRCSRAQLGIAGKTMNLALTTSDNLTIGSWFILSDPFYQAHRAAAVGTLEQPSLEVVQTALKTYPTILYCHGAAATRAAPARMLHYSSFASRLRANVFVIDYRGFGESEGVPSSDGLVEDAKTAWRWLMEQGAKPDEVMIIGHSLGTAVATGLATALAREGIKPRGVALLAPFKSMATLVETATIRGIPILQPLQSFSFGRSAYLLASRRELTAF